MSLGDELEKQEKGKNNTKRIKELEYQVGQYEKKITSLRKPRVKIGIGKVRRKAKGDFIRVIIPDTHGCFIDNEAAGAMLADLKILNPSEIILLGDHLDCSGFLAQHQTLGFVAETGYTYEEDIESANTFLDQVQNAAPNAQIDYLYGNHEERVEKWCVTMSLRNTTDAERLRKMNSPENVLSLAKRGISWYRTSKRYDKLSVPGTIKRGHCYFTHGHFFGVHAAATHVKQFGGNVVHGHTHRIQSHATRGVSTGVVVGWSIGCLCELQPMYRNRSLTDWAHGYAVQFCQADGKFSHLTIHIIDGVSYLMPMIKQISSK